MAFALAVLDVNLKDLGHKFLEMLAAARRLFLQLTVHIYRNAGPDFCHFFTSIFAINRQGTLDVVVLSTTSGISGASIISCISIISSTSCTSYTCVMCYMSGL